MGGPFRDTAKSRTTSPVFNLRNTLFHRARRAENLRMCDDSGELVNTLPHGTPRPSARGKFIESRLGALMKRRFPPVRVNQNICVNRDHSGSRFGPVASSISAKVIPGNSRPWTTVWPKRNASFFPAISSFCRKARRLSSNTNLTVQPRRPAAALTSVSKFSGRSIVAFTISF